MTTLTPLRHLLLGILLLTITACGGGGGSSPPPDVGAPPPPPPALTKAQLDETNRSVRRATFGLDPAELEQVARTGFGEWLEQQMALPPTSHRAVMESIIARRDAGEFDAFEEDGEYVLYARRIAWWHNTVTAPDAVRQRVAYALSQIFVVSDNVDLLTIYPDALITFYDVLLEHSFGNFRDLLRDVSLNPAMGFYLSHLNNRKSDPARNIFPDENYAREVMQLFSIGLFELNPDGSVRIGPNGQPIPAYDNDDIREFAKIFTGLSFGGPNAFFGNDVDPFFSGPMQMFDEAHEPGPKQLLNGTVVPDGLTGTQDIEMAIDNLFNHPNVGPFIGRQLIQRLVTSNPSPAYIERVASAFADNGQGVRGDMKAVIRAVLLDQEALAPAQAGNADGRLQEPVVRYAGLLRQFGARSDDGLISTTGFFLQLVTRQHPMSAPSVFNFYLPDHSPAGELADSGLVAPEFQITNASTIIGWPNFVDAFAFGEPAADSPEGFAPVTLDIDDWVAMAADVPQLIDALDTLLTAGQLNPQVRDQWIEQVEALSGDDYRFASALWLFLVSPDYLIQQ